MKWNLSAASVILLVSPFLAIGALMLSTYYGAKTIEIHTIVEAISNFNSENIDHQIVMVSRLPRAIGALLIGAFLAVSGALMQGMTRNYLASPAIMGVTDGSIFVITVCMVILPGASTLDMVVYSMIGSALGAGIVFGIASLIPNGFSPVRMAILGTIVGTFLGGVSQALATYYQISQNISFWYNARLHQINPEMLKLSIPLAIIGILLAMAMARSVTALSLGEDVAVNLGIKTTTIKLLTMLSVVILTGIAVALAGKIAFIGIIIPHMTRFIVGQDYRKIIPCSAAIGGIFLVMCDVISRYLNFPFETPVGVVTAMFGVPFFLYLIRTRGGGKHA